MVGDERSDPVALEFGEGVARQLAGALAPACERIVVAGSIRRRRQLVRDVELVAVPLTRPERASAQGSLFAGEEVEVNALWERIEEVSREHEFLVPIKPGSPRLEPDERWPAKRVAGSRYFRLWITLARMRADLFMATPETWGLVLTIRTGSADFSRALVTRWTEVSGGGHASEGLLLDAAGAVVPTPDEESVFRAVRCRWVPPEKRGGPADLVPVG